MATGPVHEGKTTWAACVRICPDRRLRATGGGAACALPGGFARVAGGMCGEGRQIGHHQQVDQAPAPVSEIVPQIVPAGPDRLNVPFPILHRARPQAAISATLSGVTSKSVTKLNGRLGFQSRAARVFEGRLIAPVPCPLPATVAWRTGNSNADRRGCPFLPPAANLSQERGFPLSCTIVRSMQDSRRSSASVPVLPPISLSPAEVHSILQR